jgi:hypothetical protein
MLRVYCWLLYLYPRSYRHEFGDEMTSIFHYARVELPPALLAKISFYQREFCGLLSGALRAHLDRAFGPAISVPRFPRKREFRFPRSTLFLMYVILAGVVLAIQKAQNIVQMRQNLSPATATAWGPMLMGDAVRIRACTGRGCRSSSMGIFIRAAAHGNASA